MRRDGFTLIEMLVALSVFAIAALALMRLDGFAIATAGDLRERGAARLVAGNEAALIRSAPDAPTLGTSTAQVTNHGQQFAVSRSVRRLDDARLVAVTIDVRPVAGGAPYQLTFVRPAGAP